MTPPHTHYTLTNTQPLITESFDAALPKLFELREPINFAAHELRLICELEFDFRRRHDLIICVHTCSSVPSGLTKGNWYQSAFIEHIKTNKINSTRESIKEISKCKTVKR